MNYRLITLILWPVFFFYTLKIAIRDKSSRYFFQRLGYKYPIQNNQILWIHCASVGEVNTYFPLHLKLLELHPETQFIITTNTTTGASTVNRHNAPRTTHCYLPIESSFAIKQFLKNCKPAQCLIMETEIWPLLYRYINAQNISLSIINARLSHRTLNANNWIKSLYKTSLGLVNKIVCKSEAELNNYKILGATDLQLSVGGNLKFATSSSNSDTKYIDINNRKYWVAASTHNNEEQQLTEIWKQLETDRLLVIMPRHPNRSEQIQKQLGELNVKYAVRSQQQPVTNDTQIYLADTLGELNDFMANAELVFMGGSLIKHGGQNLLEPARLGKTVICGPHMFNFKDEMKLLLEQKACIQVSSLNELETLFSEILTHPEQYQSIGIKARKLLDQQSDILDTYLSQLS